MNSLQKNKLFEKAREIAKQAYCPYSSFHVGAAILDNHDNIYVGCNVENASYGLTICAERVAIFNFVSSTNKPYAIKAIAISCPDGNVENENSLMPCGACRQVMAEFFTSDTIILIDGIGEFTLKNLLPLPFILK